jgi:NAD(P)H-dependent flavin oxidoreductase YrpB (nitropropane dioxygenase family)
LHVSPSRKGRLNAGGTHLRCLKKTEGYLYETPAQGWGAGGHVRGEVGTLALRNSTARAWEAAGRPPRGQRPGEGETLYQSPTHGRGTRYEPLVAPRDAQGDVEASSLWAGQGVGLVSRRQPAGAIIREIVEQASDVLAHLGRIAAFEPEAEARGATRS